MNNEQGLAQAYYVVSRTLVGPSEGAITFTGFDSAESYKEFQDKLTLDPKYAGKTMREIYATVAEGVTSEEAIAMCGSPEARRAVVVAQGRQVW